MLSLSSVIRFLAGAGLCLIFFGAGAASAQDVKRYVEIDLIADKRVAAPGQTFWVALRQKIVPGWHTYWRNPGDSGEPTKITWSLPEGFQASDIHWPVPEAIPVGPLLNHGYSDEVLLLSQITVPQGAEGRVTLTADSTWLVCKEICIPETGKASLDVMIGSPAQVSQDAVTLTQAVGKLPKEAPWQAFVSADETSVRLTLKDAGLDPARVAKLHFFPNEWGPIAFAAKQTVSWDSGSPTLVMARGDLKDKPVEALKGLLVINEDTGNGIVQHGFEVSAEPGPTGGSSISAVQLVGSSGGSSGVGLWQALVFALLGGAILNLMPCVFPVLSLKALSLTKHAAAGHSEARRHGLAYFAGVMASFAVLAAVLLALRGAGEALGWGFQFQSPAFVLAMAALFFALGLSLSGVFLIGTSVTNTGSSLATQGGLKGSFFTGVLASIASTPCTAPFMGAAMGFALSQPAVTAAGVILMLGIGFALPIVALSFTPALARLLPKPGAWMETMKQVLAFPLYASAGWMVWVLSIQAGSSGVLAAVVVLLAIGFAAWLLGDVKRTTVAGKVAAAAVVLLAGVGGYRLLSDGARAAPSVSATAMQDTAEPFSQAKLDSLLAAGRPVFVNFTAAWCITCKVNEQVALSSDAFRAELKKRNIAYLKGDWTKQDPQITAILERFGRAGVPLYLFYTGERGVAPDVLPQLLSEATVLKHLAKAKITPEIAKNGDQS